MTLESHGVDPADTRTALAAGGDARGIEVSRLAPREARLLFREGLVSPTAGWSAGYAQANLVILPKDAAYDFLLFCQRNPKPCPLLDVFDAGETSGPILDGDVRTDLPLYRIHVDGQVHSEVSDVTEYWRTDAVTFLIGCSFTFEHPLLAAGVTVRHHEAGVNVPMFRTSVPCRPAGRFSGPLVVSMRPVPAERVADAVRISSRYPGVHGAPVHVGDPTGLGIADLDHPDYGDPVEVRAGEVPMFWACGVTPQAALAEARLPFVVTHSPGHMLITDAPDTQYQVP